MLGLMEETYDGVVPARFFADLDAKDGVILLTDEGVVRGFSTFALLRTRFEGEDIEALFSGDTVIHRDSWGSPALFVAFAALMRQRLDATPACRHWWFLITKGLRTYLILPLYFRDFHPSCERQTPPRERRLLEHLCDLRFPGLLDRDRGLLPIRADRLKPALTDGPLSAGRSPHARHFLACNPDFAGGDELPCLCSIERENLKPRAVRMVFP